MAIDRSEGGDDKNTSTKKTNTIDSFVDTDARKFDLETSPEQMPDDFGDPAKS